MSYEKLYIRSIDFIREFPNARNADIPDELLYFWIDEDIVHGNRIVDRQGIRFLIFLMAEYFTHPPGAMPYPTEWIDRMFIDFQTLLWQEAVSRRKGTQNQIIPIFDFRRYPMYLKPQSENDDPSTL